MLFDRARLVCETKSLSGESGLRERFLAKYKTDHSIFANPVKRARVTGSRNLAKSSAASQTTKTWIANNKNNYSSKTWSKKGKIKMLTSGNSKTVQN